MNEQEQTRRIEAAARALKISNETLTERLAAIGWTEIDLNDDELAKFGDLREILKEFPIALVRLAMRELRGGKKEPQNELTGPGDVDERTARLQALGLRRKLSDADTASLVGLYVPDKPNDPVTNVLRARFGTDPVIAFNDDGTVDFQSTVEYVSGIEQGFPKAEAVLGQNGRLLKLWPVGVKPDTMVDEDPLNPGVPLLSGVSTVNHRNWNKVSLVDRKFCRLILEKGHIDPNNPEAVLQLLERAQAGKLAEAYPLVELEFRELAKNDSLPKLRVSLGKLARPQHPFGVRRQY